MLAAGLLRAAPRPQTALSRGPPAAATTLRHTPPRSLPAAAGFVTPVTYFYPVYFAVLLVHRELRDEHKCAAKYGAAWAKYKALVPYRIIPYVY